MIETIESIVEKVSFEKKPRFRTFLNKCIKISYDTPKNTYSDYENVQFLSHVFFEGLAKFSNDLTKDKKLVWGVETLSIIFEELGVELEPQDIFIYFHLKDLGKFKIKDIKLLSQLKGPWGNHKEYRLEDSEFKQALKNLMSQGLIDYKKGTVGLRLDIIFSYKRS